MATTEKKKKSASPTELFAFFGIASLLFVDMFKKDKFSFLGFHINMDTLALVCSCTLISLAIITYIISSISRIKHKKSNP